VTQNLNAPCLDCNGARAVPDDLGEYEDGYAPCPACIIDAGPTFVVYEPQPVES
jgi:hypothetical protein